jgi:hypothetical protein
MFEVTTRNWKGAITGTVRVTSNQLQSILNNLGPMETATVSRIDETLEQLAMGRQQSGGSGSGAQLH